mmetsp:Transcript_18050/g.55264  ORF Transcript_18050/g.55264 Transcript_18050/m.55264 type:complete len:257 (+) Transcript_18050:19-789(+)
MARTAFAVVSLSWFLPATTRAFVAVVPRPQLARGERRRVVLGRAAPDEYEWCFEGRFVFAPAVVRAPSELPPGVACLSLFGWTLGGYVLLEYNSSPADAYLEVVRMGALCVKNGAVGQWGRKLCVSTERARLACEDLWHVPAVLADVTLDDAGESLRLTAADNRFRVDGWRRHASPPERRLSLPVLWTPEITTLWAPLRLPPDDRRKSFNLHDLRISGSSLALRRFQLAGDDDAAPPFAICVDGLRIEIAAPNDKL